MKSLSKSSKTHFQGFIQVLLTLSFFVRVYLTIWGGFSESAEQICRHWFFFHITK